VATLHDLYPFEMPENFAGRAWRNRAALRLCVRNVDAVACVSAATQVGFVKGWPEMQEKSCVVPNAVGLAGRDGLGQLPMELKGASFVLCVAQHRANKNLAVLIDAFDLAQRRGDLAAAARLVVAGHFGPETEHLRAMIQERGLEAGVLFLRDLPDGTLRALYAGCEMVVAPSLVEGFGLPVAEALSLGCRVVCSEIAVFREVGGDACVYFDPQKGAVALADAMRRAMTLAKPAAVSFLTPAKVGERYVELYVQCLRRHSAKSLAVVVQEKV